MNVGTISDGFVCKIDDGQQSGLDSVYGVQYSQRLRGI